MAHYTGIASDLEAYAGPDVVNDGISLASIAIGSLAYIIIIVPMISFSLVASLNLSFDYVIPVAIAWVLIGIYVTERYICR
jgi:hypothetical protein